MPRDRTLVRGLGVCALTALVAAAAGGGEAFWLCVPAALLLGASARDGLETVMWAVAATVAGAVPNFAGGALGPLPSPLLVAAVLGGSVAVLHGVRRRLDADRSALRTAALTDPLTGAFNRRGLGERIDYEIARHARQRSRFTVLVLDLDGFKLVNDRFGHHAGDDLLRDVAGALHDAVREQDTVARLGGDEFCVLAPETDGPGASQLAARVSQAIGAVSTGIDALSASVGVAVFPEQGTDPVALLDAADHAAVAAKREMRASGAAYARAA